MNVFTRMSEGGTFANCQKRASKLPQHICAFKVFKHTRAGTYTRTCTHLLHPPPHSSTTFLWPTKLEEKEGVGPSTRQRHRLSELSACVNTAERLRMGDTFKQMPTTYILCPRMRARAHGWRCSLCCVKMRE